MIVRERWKIAQSCGFCVFEKCKRAGKLPALCADVIRISALQWHAALGWPQASSLRGGGVGRVPMAAPLAVRMRRRLRISTSGDLFSWSAPACEFVKHNLPPQCGSVLTGALKFQENSEAICDELWQNGREP
jgi:hypothetical protein